MYFPARSQTNAADSALQHVLNTFFGGEMEGALAAHLSKRESLSPEKLNRLEKLIEEARKAGH